MAGHYHWRGAYSHVNSSASRRRHTNTLRHTYGEHAIARFADGIQKRTPQGCPDAQYARTLSPKKEVSGVLGGAVGVWLFSSSLRFPAWLELLCFRSWDRIFLSQELTALLGVFFSLGTLRSGVTVDGTVAHRMIGV